MFRHAKPHVLACCVALLTFGLNMSATSATPATSPAGIWLTANGHGVVAIAQCGDALCGRIVGIDREPTEPMPTDIAGRSQCGLTIITNEKPAEDGTWLGNITDPRNGNAYQAKLWVDARGGPSSARLHWHPVARFHPDMSEITGHLTAECGLA